MSTPASHIWIPSTARVLVLDSFVPVPRGTVALVPAPLIWPPKAPVDVLDYGFDISPAILGNDGDGIATLDYSVTPANPGDLVVNSASADGAVAILWFAQGVAGTTYAVTLTITTLNGRAISRTVQLPVLALSTPGVAATAIQTSTGAAITDQNGNPIVIGS